MPPDNSLRANLDNHQEQLIACKLSTPELHQRKVTIIAGVRQHILARRDLEDGVALKFVGSDEMVDTLVTFIKTERICCDFFTFTLAIEGNGNPVWLTIRGPRGAKDFITSELGF